MGRQASWGERGDEVTRGRTETREVVARKEPRQAVVSDLASAEGRLRVGVAAPRRSPGAHLGVLCPGNKMHHREKQGEPYSLPRPDARLPHRGDCGSLQLSNGFTDRAL